VCHLEAVLGLRQASISHHLMVLRKAGLVASRRDGRNIFYRISHPEVLDVLRQAALIAGCDSKIFHDLSLRPVNGCPCPDCDPGLDPDLTCQSIKRPRSS
jgi:DNA-binding transcriptional ArsR family regulator